MVTVICKSMTFIDGIVFCLRVRAYYLQIRDCFITELNSESIIPKWEDNFPKNGDEFLNDRTELKRFCVLYF